MGIDRLTSTDVGIEQAEDEEPPEEYPPAPLDQLDDEPEGIPSRRESYRLAAAANKQATGESAEAADTSPSEAASDQGSVADEREPETRGAPQIVDTSETMGECRSLSGQSDTGNDQPGTPARDLASEHGEHGQTTVGEQPQARDRHASRKDGESPTGAHGELSDLGPGKATDTPGRNDRQILIKELIESGIKCTPENILAIARDSSGRIAFLENGTPKAGMTHIVERHGAEFTAKGISEGRIPEFLMKAVTEGKRVGAQRTRPIYEVAFNDKLYRVAIQVGSNGYIVGANMR